MACHRRPPSRLTRLLMSAMFGLAIASQSLADEATLMNASLTSHEAGMGSGLFLNATYEFDLSKPLLDALYRGIPLYFVFEFQLDKSRWYWRNKQIMNKQFTVRLTYNPITERYRLSYNGISHDFDSLNSVLPYIKSIRGWQLMPNLPEYDDQYVASVRFFLDTSKLPKPMQVTTTNRSEWVLESPWTTLALPMGSSGDNP